MADLRSYLADVEGDLFRPADPVSVVHQVTALQRALAEAGRWPPIRIDRPVLPGGEISDFPLLTNLFASRQMVAAMFGLDDHRGAARAFSKSLARQIPPRIIDQGPVPVQDVVEEGEDLDLRRQCQTKSA
jgi:4-hydroxy-3-polyprenylbenzoate decarboxylase